MTYVQNKTRHYSQKVWSALSMFNKKEITQFISKFDAFTHLYVFNVVRDDRTPRLVGRQT